VAAPAIHQVKLIGLSIRRIELHRIEDHPFPGAEKQSKAVFPGLRYETDYSVDAENPSNLVARYLFESEPDKEKSLKYSIEFEVFLGLEGGFEEEGLDGFIRFGVLGIVWPYFRETLASLTMRAGYPALYIPLINWLSLMEMAKEEMLEAHED